MKNNKFYNELLSEGFSDNTLSSLTKKQVNVLHSRIFSEATFKVSAENVDKIKDKVNSDDTIEVSEETTKGEINEWGSSDQTAFNRSVHSDLGEPETMPSPFSDELESAVESAVDIYWSEWEEYQIDKNSLIDNGKRAYLRSHFKEQFNMLVQMFAPATEEDDDKDTIETDLDEDSKYQKPLSVDKGWDKTVESSKVSDNRLDKTDGTLNSVKFVKAGTQSKAVSKSGHTGFAQPNEKGNIGGKTKGNKSMSGSVSESKTTKKELLKYLSEITGETPILAEIETETLPEFMNFDLFDGKLGSLVGNSPVETPVKPTTIPGIKPGKPIIKPKHAPKPKAQMEEEDLEENGRSFAGGDETLGGLPKQRGSKHPKMKK